MPKRTDLKKIMLIGSGPIVIGQGCEFDYSGVQACKVLRREGYEVVLVNSNPATIMTDPEMADRTYIEPLNVDILHEIIRRERPDALLPTLGGQTALNLAMELHEKGILSRYNVELIGAKAESIARAEDRKLFKDAMLSIGLDLPRSGSAHSMSEAKAIAQTIGSWPLIIRPGFTLGGTGGGIAHSEDEFEAIVNRGLDASLNNEVLIEESLLGWKEFEMEVMRDKKGNAVIVCSIENLDPMGVHTGDSITVAPIQSLDDRAYQAMRDDSLKVMEAIGVETGGSNVQWSINPVTGRRIIIEMNPRVSRSSALASKATGFPIAKIAALLAVGYTLDELKNDITQSTPSCFEPALDYVVTKVPRFTFEKFPKADSTLGTQMKSVGEAMAIGSNFKQSMQKALRSLETGFGGFGACAKCEQYLAYDDETLAKEVARPSAERIFVVYAAFRRGWDVEKLYEITKIDRYFLRHLEELAQFEDEIRAAGSLEALCKDKDLFRQAKEFGYSDIQIGYIFGKTPEEVMAARNAISLKPSYYSVDTCAGEFEAVTPYYYSCYADHTEPVREVPNRDKKKRIMVLGGGPNRIGQGIEFDYCCCHAAFTLKKQGYEVIMVNSNPETVSTDYDTSDKLYFEPLTLEDVMGIYERENCYGVIVQFGGQTPLNLAMRLKKAGANVVGTSPEDIDLAEDRDFFKQLVDKVGIKQAASGIAHNVEEALAIVEEIGYPVLVRPSFVLGGRGMVIVYKEKYLRKFVEEAAAIGEGKPILIDRFLEDATELDVDCISDGKTTVVGAIMEHVEPAGIHSGDSASVIPPMTLSKDLQEKVRGYAKEFAKELHVVGLMNMQLAVKDGELYMIEVNPRASRTVPFVSKSIGVPLASYASRCMLGETLEEIGFTEEVHVPYVSVKEAVFPFVKFPGVDVTLSPEMKSTGEVMSLDRDRGLAYLKSQLASGNRIPGQGNIFVSLKDEDKARTVPLIRQLVELGYGLYATRGTSTMLYNEGIKTRAVFRISRGRPNLLDLIHDKEVQWIVNTSETGAEAMVDEIQMRSKAVVSGVPITTTIAALTSTVEGLMDKHDYGRFEVCSLQEYHRHIVK
ncbi:MULTISPECIES: carbamoyl-phosphate synthase large subunit [unclassified Fibrobacter]|uniref:carbamoyl-phosphate synthase large subunit n=1 Tax=unclassified Fibrobacter TaxID=2634177 RepID=UPI000D6CAC5A|nr:MULTISPECIES: carbamoyl-phosphate synthase large subunit [unclassified Fibrobacter]PWJ59148.1 carbamoyl-phosphate synthase large subunit [Fibrobacter sp. UWR4]PZW63702.1 carbamoyl-phosphate synthase large subunit [Fibrobacter sp. UWR1]